MQWDGSCYPGALEDALTGLEVSTDAQAERIANLWLTLTERKRGLYTTCSDATAGMSLADGLDSVEQLVNYVAERQGLLDALLAGVVIPTLPIATG
eukprot:COSAG06_NODE_4430_length_4274_cov_11.496648_6_plen_96_part_00